jgi:hypothetical protein
LFLPKNFTNPMSGAIKYLERINRL